MLGNVKIGFVQPKKKIEKEREINKKVKRVSLKS